MIKDLQFTDSNGYIRATIDNESIHIPLKEIVKLPSQIINISSNNTIPIYTDIPIDVEFYYKTDNEYENEDDIKFDLYTDIDIIPMYKAEQHKVNGTWEYQNIFKSYDDYIESEGLLPINKGTATVRLFDDNNNIIHEIRTDFNNHRLTTTIDNELDFGKYTIVIYYHGSKYFLPTSLSYDIYVTKRELKYIFDKEGYSGNPLEEVNINVQLRDVLNNYIIPDCYVHYVYDNKTYITKSNENGYINIAVQLPSQKNTCNGDIVSYDLQLYIDNDTYWSNIVTRNIVINKLHTKINAQSVPSNQNETEFYIKGNVDANNYSIIENAKYGDMTLSFGDEQQYETTISSEGLFNFLLNSTDFQNVAESDIETESFEPVKDVRTAIALNTSQSYNVGEEFSIKATVTAKATTKKITEGIVYFTVKTKTTPSEIVTQYISELNSNGNAFGYFYPSTKGTYKINAEYKGIFEYKDSTASKDIKIV